MVPLASAISCTNSRGPHGNPTTAVLSAELQPGYVAVWPDLRIPERWQTRPISFRSRMDRAHLFDSTLAPSGQSARLHIISSRFPGLGCVERVEELEQRGADHVSGTVSTLVRNRLRREKHP